MGYEPYNRRYDPQRDYYGRGDPQDYGHDYGSGRDFTYSSARDYRAAGEADEDRSGRYRGGGGGRGGPDYHEERSRFDRDTLDRGQMRGRGYGGDRMRSQGRYGAGASRQYDEPYRGSYMSDGHRALAGQHNDANAGYDYDDRGFLARAGDEVRSWFGDEDAERRRYKDERYDAQRAHASDHHYANWRRERMRELDRDYDEYRRENASRFESEFSSWRAERQGQRDSLQRVQEHMEVVGSDGEHVGTVDKVRGDRILLTISDPDAGGRHHSIPSRWIESVDTKVMIRKTAEEAQSHWRDEERNGAMLNESDEQPHTLNRSFSGTY